MLCKAGKNTIHHLRNEIRNSFYDSLLWNRCKRRNKQKNERVENIFKMFTWNIKFNGNSCQKWSHFLIAIRKQANFSVHHTEWLVYWKITKFKFVLHEPKPVFIIITKNESQVMIHNCIGIKQLSPEQRTTFIFWSTLYTLKATGIAFDIIFILLQNVLQWFPLIASDDKWFKLFEAFHPITKRRLT